MAATDAVILLIGLHGAGKSSFVRQATGEKIDLDPRGGYFPRKFGFLERLLTKLRMGITDIITSSQRHNEVSDVPISVQGKMGHHYRHPWSCR